MTISASDTAVGRVVVGMCFLILAVLIKDSLSLEVSIALISVIVCASILTTQFLHAADAYSPFLIVACFQACFLLVLSKASFKGLFDGEHAVAVVCKDIAYFVLPIALGVIFGMALGSYQSFVFLLMVLLFLALIVLVLRGRNRAVSSAEALSDARSYKATSPTPAIDLKVKCDAFAQRYKLTGREADILVLLAQGHTLSRIANILFLSQNTAKKYRGSLYAKSGVSKRQELIDLLDQQSIHEMCGQ